MSDHLKWPGTNEWQPQPQWQRSQAAPAVPVPDMEVPPSLAFPENRVYVPYEKRHGPYDLILFCATLPAQFPCYQHLVNYSFDQHHGQFFTLFYPFMTVNVKGHALAEIVQAILLRECAIIREWHRDLYDPPKRGIPVIQSITIAPMGDESR